MTYSEPIYFDQAATSYPKPPAVMAAVKRALRDAGGNPGRSGHRLSVAAAEGIYETREAVASLFSSPYPEGVIFTCNATYALNLVITGYAMTGGHILLSDMEHNAVRRPVLAAAERYGCHYEIYPTGGDTAAEIKKRIRADTVLVAANHASNICGRVLPAEAIGETCRKAGVPFLLDASQSAGHLPIDVEKMGIDVLCAPAHKGLYGIQGCGFAVFRAPSALAPLVTGGSGVSSLAPEMPETLPERYEAGTLPTPAIFALNEGIRAVCKSGIERVAAHTGRLERRLTSLLSDIPGVRVILPDEHGSGILSFVCDGFSPEEIAARLDEKEIAVRAGLHCAPLAHQTLGTLPGGTVRVSVGMTNTEKECELFAARLREIL